MCYPSHTNSHSWVRREKKNRLSLSGLKIKPTICLLKTSFFPVIKLQPRADDDADASVHVCSARNSSYQITKTSRPVLSKSSTLFTLLRPASTRASKCRLIFIEDCKSSDTNSDSVPNPPKRFNWDDLTNPSSHAHTLCVDLWSSYQQLIDERVHDHDDESMRTIIEFISVKNFEIYRERERVCSDGELVMSVTRIQWSTLLHSN